ncbi:MAG: hypothetical protein OFPII_21940 [Osedax symbiont Rs1]|nr:MAG: hypothetical protein OFPII_21940 [Osedax symbiont Rs1]
MKISKRLLAIDEMIKRPYQQIWDCCCDHGLLGMTLLKRGAAQQLHFVDRVPVIMEQLTTKLNIEFPYACGADQWQVHCIDVLELPLADSSTEQAQLIVIAGVGGEQTQLIVQHLLARFPAHHLEFLLCPLRHQYKLRAALQFLELRLIDERLVKENKWCYEIIHVGKHLFEPTATALIAAGSKMWNNPGQLHSHYLQQCINHYRRALRNCVFDQQKQAELHSILNEYLQIERQLTIIGEPLDKSHTFPVDNQSLLS